jgi:hypothetical protein
VSVPEPNGRRDERHSRKPTRAFKVYLEGALSPDEYWALGILIDRTFAFGHWETMSSRFRLAEVKKELRWEKKSDRSLLRVLGELQRKGYIRHTAGRGRDAVHVVWITGGRVLSRDHAGFPPDFEEAAVPDFGEVATPVPKPGSADLDSEPRRISAGAPCPFSAGLPSADAGFPAAANRDGQVDCASSAGESCRIPPNNRSRAKAGFKGSGSGDTALGRTTEGPSLDELKHESSQEHVAGPGTSADPVTEHFASELDVERAARRRNDPPLPERIEGARLAAEKNGRRDWPLPGTRGYTDRLDEAHADGAITSWERRQMRLFHLRHVRVFSAGEQREPNEGILDAVREAFSA